jgi:hypothetical protein
MSQKPTAGKQTVNAINQGIKVAPQVLYVLLMACVFIALVPLVLLEIRLQERYR